MKNIYKKLVNKYNYLETDNLFVDINYEESISEQIDVSLVRTIRRSKTTSTCILHLFKVKDLS